MSGMLPRVCFRSVIEGGKEGAWTSPYRLCVCARAHIWVHEWVSVCDCIAWVSMLVCVYGDVRECLCVCVAGRGIPSRPWEWALIYISESNTQKWIVQREHMCWLSTRFYWEGVLQRRATGWGTQENCSATRLTVLDFLVIGLVSGLSLANHSDSESFLVVHTLFSRDGCQREGFWEVVRHVVSPFDLAWILLIGGGLLVLCSSPGPPVIKYLKQMVTVVSGHGERFQSVLLLTFEHVWKSSVIMLSVCVNVCECVCTWVCMYVERVFVSVCQSLGIHSISGDSPIVHR